MEGEEGGEDTTLRGVSPSSWMEREVGEGGERGGRREEREGGRNRGKNSVPHFSLFFSSTSFDPKTIQTQNLHKV